MNETNLPDGDETPDDAVERWLAALNDDDSAIRIIGEAMAQLQPVPESLLAGVEAAWGSRDVDAELALLLSDETPVGASRDGARPRQLSFRSSVLEIEVSVSSEDDGVVAEGLVFHAFGEGAIVVVEAEATVGRRVGVEVDRFGRFLVELGWVSRFRLHATSGAHSMVTPWMPFPE